MKNIAIYQSKLLNDYYSIKKYNDDYYRLFYHKTAVKNSGFESEIENLKIDRNINDEKLGCNISRARTKIFEYAMCNKFDYFMTLTLDPKKYNRYDLARYIKDLGQYIRDQRKKYKIDIQYLLIPEPHKDGAWHMHGLTKGMPDEELELFTLQDMLPYKVLELIEDGHKIYNWLSYAEKFGYNTLEEVRSTEAVSNYIRKYISKALVANLSREKEKKLYYVTRGLKTADKVKEGHLTSRQLVQIPFDYENDYVKIKTLTGLEYLKLTNQLL